MDDPFIEIDESRHADACCDDLRVTSAQVFDGALQVFQKRLRTVEVLGGNWRRVVDQVAAEGDSDLDRGASKINSQREFVL